MFRRSCVLLIFIYSLLNAQTEIKIDFSKEYQTIDNFAASDCWSMQKIGAWELTQKEKVADLLFSLDKGIGLSAWRFNIGGGINTQISHPWRTVETFEVRQGEYDWTKQEEERWFLQAAKDRGVDQFIAFVNSPTRRMTRNGRTNCNDGLGSTNLKDGYEGQFAKYLVDVLKHFRDEWGINFNYISPVNEPQWEWNQSNQEGNRASNQDIKLIVDSLYAEIQKQGIQTEISLVESGDLRSWYEQRSDITNKYKEAYGSYLYGLFNTSIKDKIAKHFAGHSYWSDLISTELVQHRQSLYTKMSPYLKDGWKYWMSEYCILTGPEGAGGGGRDLTIKTALDVARVIHYDLTMCQASAWQWWTAVSSEDYKDGLIYTDYKNNPGSHNIIESKTLWALGNYSRFIRPGSIRIDLSGAADKYGLLGSAYLNADRNKLIIVVLNMSNSAKEIILTNSGLSADKKIKTYIPYVTTNSADDNLKEYSSFPADNNYIVPAKSIVTFVGDIVDLTNVNDEGDIPNQYKLLQNFPNPFNSGTMISFNLPEAAYVTLKIYDTLGQEICTLINDVFNPGIHSVNWDANNYVQKISSGIYICHLKAGNFSASRKMILLQ